MNGQMVHFIRQQGDSSMMGFTVMPRRNGGTGTKGCFALSRCHQNELGIYRNNPQGFFLTFRVLVTKYPALSLASPRVIKLSASGLIK